MVTSPAKPFPAGSVFGGVPPTCVTSGPLTGVCTSNQVQTNLTSTYSFGGGNEYVMLGATLTGDTNYGPFSLTGTEDLTVLGRGHSSQTGTFDILVTEDNFSGPFLDYTLDLSFIPPLAGTSNGSVSVTLQPFPKGT